MFAEDFRAGIKTYELLRREDANTGLVEWKRVFVKDCVHGLSNTLNSVIKPAETIGEDLSYDVKYAFSKLIQS